MQTTWCVLERNFKSIYPRVGHPSSEGRVGSGSNEGPRVDQGAGVPTPRRKGQCPPSCLFLKKTGRELARPCKLTAKSEQLFNAAGK